MTSHNYPHIPKDILEEILCKFIINLPQEELHPSRIFFPIEEACWFYNDLIVEKQDRLPKIKQKKFAQMIIDNCQLLNNQRNYFDKHFKQFERYRSEIPVYGAIILNTSLDKIVLVMDYGCTHYSFPKGKVNQNEDGLQCAIRESWEEIGYNCQQLISEENYIEYIPSDKQKVSKMYIIFGVPEDTKFKTQTRKEIGLIKWISISDIDKGIDKDKLQGIVPYLYPLKIWINNQKKLDQNQALQYKRNQYEDFCLKLKNIQKIIESENQLNQNEQNPFKTFKLQTFNLHNCWICNNGIRQPI